MSKVFLKVISIASEWLGSLRITKKLLISPSIAVAGGHKVGRGLYARR